MYTNAAIGDLSKEKYLRQEASGKHIFTVLFIDLVIYGLSAMLIVGFLKG